MRSAAVEEHLCAWVPAFARAVAQAPHAPPLLRAATPLLARVVELDHGLLRAS